MFHYQIYNTSIYYALKNMKKSYKNNKFKLVGSTWDEEFELPDGLYSVSDIEDYFEGIKKHEKLLIAFQSKYVLTL